MVSVLPQDHNRRVTKGYTAKSAKQPNAHFLKNHNDENNRKHIANNLERTCSAYPGTDSTYVDRPLPTSAPPCLVLALKLAPQSEHEENLVLAF